MSHWQVSWRNDDVGTNNLEGQAREAVCMRSSREIIRLSSNRDQRPASSSIVDAIHTSLQTIQQKLLALVRKSGADGDAVVVQCRVDRRHGLEGFEL